MLAAWPCENHKKIVAVYIGAIGALAIALVLNDPLVTYSSFWNYVPTAPNVISLIVLLASLLRFITGLSLCISWPKAIRMVAAICLVICAMLVAYIDVSNILVMNNSEKLGRADVFVDGEIAYLAGDIDRTSPSRIRLLIKSEHIRLVLIDSLGGLDGAARVIAEELNSHYIAVIAARECASACLTLWANTAIREAYPRTNFGIHKAHMGDGRSAGLMEKLFINIIDQKLMQDLVRIGFSPELVTGALRKPTEVVTWIEGMELEQMGVALIVVR